MTAPEYMAPDELATQTKDILLSSSHTLLPRKGWNKQGYISEAIPRLIEERRKLKQRRTRITSHTSKNNTPGK